MEAVAECGFRVAGSWVSAVPNLGEVEGGGLTDMRSAGKDNGCQVTIFRKVRPYHQSKMEIVQYH